MVNGLIGSDFKGCAVRPTVNPLAERVGDPQAKGSLLFKNEGRGRVAIVASYRVAAQYPRQVSADHVYVEASGIKPAPKYASISLLMSETACSFVAWSILIPVLSSPGGKCSLSFMT